MKVEPALKRQYSVEFSITLNSSYTSFDEFNNVPIKRRNFVKKLSELFGDKDTSSIVVSGYQTGSLIVIWHNKTLPVDKCAEDEIEKLRKVKFLPSLYSHLFPNFCVLISEFLVQTILHLFR